MLKSGVDPCFPGSALVDARRLSCAFYLVNPAGRAIPREIDAVSVVPSNSREFISRGILKQILYRPITFLYDMNIKLSAGAFLGALLLVPAVGIAAEFRAGEQPSLSANERIADDLYMAGGNVTSSGAITGDLVVAGGNILVQGAVSADLAAMGGSIIILGNVGDDLRIGGGNITIGGPGRGDVV